MTNSTYTEGEPLILKTEKGFFLTYEGAPMPAPHIGNTLPGAVNKAVEMGYQAFFWQDLDTRDGIRPIPESIIIRSTPKKAPAPEA